MPVQSVAQYIALWRSAIVLDVDLGEDLVARAEQAVAVLDVERGIRRAGRGRDVAVERRRAEVGGVLAQRDVRALARVVEAAAGLAARAVEVARHLERALDPHADAGLVVDRLDVRHGEVGRVPLNDAVGEVRVAEQRERVVADVQRALGQVALARDREVPGEVEAPAPDPRLLLSVVKIEFMCARRLLDQLVVRFLAVAVERGTPRPPRGRAVRVAQPAQRDDVARPLVPVDRRADLEVHVAPALRVRVELGPDRVALAGLRVDHDDRRLARRCSG